MLQHGSFAGKPNPQTTKGKHPPASKPKAPAPAKTSQGPSKQQPKPKAPAQAKPHLKQQQQPRPTAAAPPKPAPRATLRHPAQQAQRASAGKAPDEETLASNYARLAAEDRGSLRFEGELRFARNNYEARAWVSELLEAADASSSPILLGFDSETPVVWGNRPDGSTVTRQNRVALLQLSYHKPSRSWPVCLLLQLSALGFHDKRLVELLEHPNIIKVGMGVACDMHELQRDYKDEVEFQPQGLLDLHLLAEACGVYKTPPAAVLEDELAKQARGIKTFNRREQWGLAGLLERLTGYSLVKKRKIVQSNWARRALSPEQLEYAAADAFASLVCCTALNVHFLQQQSAQLVQQQLLSQPYGIDAQQLPQEFLAASPMQMALWEVSKGGSLKFRKLGKDAREPWLQLLQRCCAATARRLQQTQENAGLRAEDADVLDWQLGYYYDPASSRSGYQDSPF